MLCGKRDFMDMIRLRVLIWEDNLENPSGPNTITGSKSVIRRRFKEGSREDATLMALKVKERAMRQAIQANSRSQKGQGNDFSPRAFKGASLANTLT